MQRRPRVAMRCGKDRFPRSPLLKQILDLATPKREPKHKACTLADDKHFGYSTKVLIHGWQKRRLQVEQSATCNK